MTLKVVSKAACDYMFSIEYRPRTEKVSPKRNFDAALFRTPPVILKIVPKAGYDMFSRENRPMTEKVSRNRNFDAASWPIFRIREFFQRNKQKLYI